LILPVKRVLLVPGLIGRRSQCHTIGSTFFELLVLVVDEDVCKIKTRRFS